MSDVTAFVMPDVYHIANVAGTSFFISTEVRRELESWMNDSDDTRAFLLVEDLSGSELTIARDCVRSIWSTSLPMREWERAFNRALREEEPIAERE